MSADRGKQNAARAALDLVQSGMKLGLGTGSTAAIFLQLLGEKTRAGFNVAGVPTSEATARLAEQCGIPLISLDDDPVLDLTIDGADEIDDQLRLLKGGGGALLREKIVASASSRMVVIADASKRVETLGKFPLPVEVVRFGLASTMHYIAVMAEDAGCTGDLRVRSTPEGKPFVTDQGNLIVDCAFGRIAEPELLADALETIPGVVEHGLFVGLADQAIFGSDSGVEILDAEHLEDDDEV